MTRFANSEFSRMVALSRFCPQMTIKAAKESARGHGFTIRRDVDGFDCFDVYPVGFGDMAQTAECPAEAEFMAAARARDIARNRLSFNVTPTFAAMAEELTARAEATPAFDLAPGSIRVEVTSDVKLNCPRVNFRDAESGRVISSECFPKSRARTASDIAGRLAAAVEYAAEELGAEQAEACREAIDAGITLDSTGPDWREGGRANGRPVDGCGAFYAQECDGPDGKPGPYAFGATPYAALSALADMLDKQAAEALAAEEPAPYRVALVGIHGKRGFTTVDATSETAAMVAAEAEAGAGWTADSAWPQDSAPVTCPACDGCGWGPAVGACERCNGAGTVAPESAATAPETAATGARSLSAAATPQELLGGYGDGMAGRYARTAARAMAESDELAEALAEFWEWESEEMDSGAPARLSEAEARRMIEGGHVAQIAMPF